MVTLIGKSDTKLKSKYICECGKEFEAFTSNVNRGFTNSCGCLTYKRLSPKHGLASTRISAIWRGMRVRCRNKNNHAYKWYGAKGVSIIQEWDDLKKFHDWSMSNGYTDSMTIDRIDPNGNYEPSNCRWVTISENNSANKRLLMSNNTTGYRGVSFVRGRYIAQLRIGKRLFQKGGYETAKDAAYAYDTMSIVYGSKMPRNFP